MEDVHVSFRVPGRGWRGGRVQAVDGVSLTVQRGEALALVGESGSGKSTCARALTGLVHTSRGTIRVDGTDLSRLRGRALRDQRGKVQMVFQDPYSSLDPSMVVGESIAEVATLTDRLRGNALRDRVAELLGMVGLRAEHATRYPHEFSGGQRQRIAIARALARRPELVVMDEAISALDVSSQAQIIELLVRLRTELGLSYLFISHDLSAMRALVDRVAVLYLGRLVEIRSADEFYGSPVHPYSASLITAVPTPDPVVQRERERVVITGEMPDPANPPSGCTFHTRCPYRMDVCVQQRPATRELRDGGTVACHLPAPVSVTLAVSASRA
ncbi:ABC transporter ATP-binding protein [Georgenia yuyongxinii]|uniref:ABC transporter ATP-binding protein n=2 Tax=Georgenia yuyongxinii TaxID=2589797 RepID=A0A552WSX1_9MICO|nr:ABC transporter ATP-binding protein [Georgenia yuyongxinii]